MQSEEERMANDAEMDQRKRCPSSKTRRRAKHGDNVVDRLGTASAKGYSTRYDAGRAIERVFDLTITDERGYVQDQQFYTLRITEAMARGWIDEAANEMGANIYKTYYSPPPVSLRVIGEMYGIGEKNTHQIVRKISLALIKRQQIHDGKKICLI